MAPSGSIIPAKGFKTTERLSDEETKRLRDEETKRRRDEETMLKRYLGSKIQDTSTEDTSW